MNPLAQIKWLIALSVSISLCVLAVGTADAGEDGIPSSLKGFQGMMTGTLVKKGTTSFTFKVASIKKTWKGNKAEKPEAAVGTTLILSLRKVSAHHSARIKDDYAGMKDGDRVDLEAFDLGGDVLFVKEWLRKTKD